MAYKRYKHDPAPEAQSAAQLAQHLASANQNAALLAASFSRLAGQVASGAGGAARVRLAGAAARPTGMPWRSASACGPGG